MNDQVEGEVNNEPDDVEVRAKEMGWVPEDQWKGDPDKWTSAQEYVDKGEQVLPILRANNRRLQDDLLTMRNENVTMRQELQATRSIVQGLEGKFNASLQKQLKEQRASLKASLRDAVEDRDIDREMDIRDQLSELSEAEQKAKTTTPSQQVPPSNDKSDPAFDSWLRDNPWFNGSSAEDRRKTKAVVRAAEDLRDDGDTTTGREFYDKALAAVETKSSNRSVSKVDNGNSRSSSPPGSKSYGSLPQEAKEACMADAEEFVGEGKLFKTVDEWKNYYTQTYFGE